MYMYFPQYNVTSRADFIPCAFILFLYGWMDRQIDKERHAAVWGKMTFLNLALLLTSETCRLSHGSGCCGLWFWREKKSNATLLTFEFLSYCVFFLPNYCITPGKLCHGAKSVCRVGTVHDSASVTTMKPFIQLVFYSWPGSAFSSITSIDCGKTPRSLQSSHQVLFYLLTYTVKNHVCYFCWTDSMREQTFVSSCVFHSSSQFSFSHNWKSL